MMDARIKSGHDEWVCGHTNLNFKQHAMHAHSFAISRRDAPEFLLSTFRPHIRGRRECRALGAPAASRAKMKKHTSKSPRSHRKHPAFPAQWF
jgi:hypothetical protein